MPANLPVLFWTITTWGERWKTFKTACWKPSCTAGPSGALPRGKNLQAYGHASKNYNEADGRICRKDVCLGLCEQPLAPAASVGDGRPLMIPICKCGTFAPIITR